MNKRIIIISDYIDLVMHSIAFYIITLSLIYITTKEINYIAALYPCIIVFLSYFVRKLSKKYYQFIIFHTLMFIPIIIMKTNIVLLLVMTATYLILFKLSSFYYSKKIDHINISIPSIYLVAIFGILILSINNKSISSLLSILTGIYIILFFIAKYVFNVREYLHLYGDGEFLDPHKMLKINNIYIVGFLLLLIICLIMIKAFDIDKLFNVLFSPIKNLFWLLLDSGYGFLQKSLNINRKHITMQEQDNSLELLNMQDVTSGNNVLQIAMIILKFIAFVMIMAYIIYTVFMFINNFIKNKVQVVNEDSTTIKLNGNDNLFNYLKKKNTNFPDTENGKIRLEYYKKVRKYKKKISKLNNLTPNEINNIITKQYKNDINELTKKYTHARYDKDNN